MNKKIQIKFKYILVFAVAFLVLCGLVFYQNEAIDTVEVFTKETVEIKKNEQNITIDYTDVIPTEVVVENPITNDNGVKIKASMDHISPRTDKQEQVSVKKQVITPKKQTSIKANKYVKTMSLPNGQIVSETVSTGKLLSQKISLTTFDKTIHKETTKEITKIKRENVWFLNFEPKFNILQPTKIAGFGTSIDYTVKNRIRIGGGFEYYENSLLPKYYVNLKIGIKL